MMRGARRHHSFVQILIIEEEIMKSFQEVRFFFNTKVKCWNSGLQFREATHVEERGDDSLFSDREQRADGNAVSCHGDNAVWCADKAVFGVWRDALELRRE